MSRPRPLAIVTDVDQRVGLYAAQSLHRLGFRVRGLVPRRAPRSRALERVEATSYADLPATVAAIARQEPVELVLPVSIHAAFSLAGAVARGESLPRLLAASLDVLERANDKEATIRAAERRGIAVPRTIAIDGIAGLRGALEDIPLPAVVKLRNDANTFLSPSDRYRILRTPDDVENAASAFAPELPLLVQQYVEGQGCGVGILRGPDGARHAAVAYRRVRECPPSGGPSSIARSVHEPEWIERADALLDELGLVGAAAHVEFKETVRGPVLMEVNPRLWGTVRLAEHAGQPIIERWVALNRGKAPTPKLEYRANVRARSLVHDLRGAWIALTRGRIRPAIEVALDLFDPTIRPLLFAADDWRGSASLLGFRHAATPYTSETVPKVGGIADAQVPETPTVQETTNRSPAVTTHA